MNRAKPIVLRGTIEPFFDEYLVERFDGASMRLHNPERREIALRCDAPWESAIVGFTSLVQEDDCVRLYYRAATDRDKSEDFQWIAMAESYNGGLSFERPDFGLIVFNGAKRNNLVAHGEMPIVPPVFRDTNSG